MKNKNIWKYLLIILIIITLIFSIKYANTILKPSYILFKEKWDLIKEKIVCTNCRDGIISDDKIYIEYNKFIGASPKTKALDHFYLLKFFYDEDDDSFFSENKAYKKVSEENMNEVEDYFNIIYKDYYDTRIFPEDFKLKEVISENDYYYIHDEFFENKELYRPYEKFEFYYYDVEEHVLYWFGK